MKGISMSTNLYVSASREVIVLKTGEPSIQSENFSVYQTPTQITYDILASDDKAQSYRDWVNSISKDEEMEVYADDIFEENEPVGKTVYNPWKEHIAEFDAWLSDKAAEGYDIEYSCM